MASASGPGAAAGIEQLGLKEGLVVQELGWDEDVDNDLRDDIMDTIDADLIEEALDAVDVVLLWLRDDVDVVDSLVDAQRDLSETGFILLLTPKIGRPGYVDPSDISEGAEAAGMSLTRSVNVAPDWHAHKVVRPRGRR